MGIVVFILLALITAVAIAYPLLPGQRMGRPVPVVTDSDIEQAVRRLRGTRSKGGLACPSCGKAYKPEDRFCVACGAALPEAASSVLVCPSCGASVRKGDNFCPKCGHDMVAGEAA
jgi:predicted RNA-binding Zn-ribbon protein involved in translation (DUF1610 family)